jgi:hypothetical protein
MIPEEENPKIKAILNDVSADKIAVIESLLTERDSTILEQESKILALEKEISWLKEQFKLAQHRKFGRSSENSQTLQTEIIFN